MALRSELLPGAVVARVMLVVMADAVRSDKSRLAGPGTRPRCSNPNVHAVGVPYRAGARPDILGGGSARRRTQPDRLSDGPSPATVNGCRVLAGPACRRPARRTLLPTRSGMVLCIRRVLGERFDLVIPETDT
ncbi:hypothetical protein Pen01_40120 [Phytomonospora endophytica]|nr:hypothetical protein Pen01_40120 [Phytomonospora endophytica]